MSRNDNPQPPLEWRKAAAPQRGKFAISSLDHYSRLHIVGPLTARTAAPTAVPWQREEKKRNYLTTYSANFNTRLSTLLDVDHTIPLLLFDNVAPSACRAGGACREEPTARINGCGSDQERSEPQSQKKEEDEPKSFIVYAGAQNKDFTVYLRSAGLRQRKGQANISVSNQLMRNLSCVCELTIGRTSPPTSPIHSYSSIQV